MSDRLLPEQSTFSDKDEMLSRSPHRWLIGLWIFSMVIGTTGWWVGLAWAATLFAQRAIS
jgi:hypothetical protein